MLPAHVFFISLEQDIQIGDVHHIVVGTDFSEQLNRRRPISGILLLGSDFQSPSPTQPLGGSRGRTVWRLCIS